MEKTTGLSPNEAVRRLAQHGENRLVAAKKTSALKIFAGQFRDLMIMILLCSTVISVLMGEITEAAAIIAIVFLNAVLGFVQEFRTERTLEALKDMAAPTAKVLRGGRNITVPAAELVPGDVVALSAGDRIPADAKLFEAVAMQCDEALLTGESLPVDKDVSSNVFMGASVTKGHGTAEVTATGMRTEMGKIAGMLRDIEEELTPLQKRLAQLGKYIAAGCLIICAIVSLAGVIRGERLFDMLITGISLAVAAVPEGLPAIVTISLALAVNRILKRQALIRRLHSVETLGCANVICTDKTGTLTENKMTVRSVFTLADSFEVTGSGFERGGGFYRSGRKIGPGRFPALKRLCEIAAECSSSRIWESPLGGVWETEGEPTELGLLVMAAKAGVTKSEGETCFLRYAELPFDSDRKRMSVLVRDPAGKSHVFTKGAPDLLLDRCRYVMEGEIAVPLTPAHKRRILEANEQMAQKAMRVLAFAYKDDPKGMETAESALTFAGLAGMLDPPRREVFEAVAKCRRAGIKTVMITGDHKITALAVAKEIGLVRNAGAMAGTAVLTGAQLDAMNEEALDGAINRTSVFARVTPSHKLRIVRAFKNRGYIAAMTGDGVNDAPAVKEADIGVSMGMTGTDVTKQSASIILLDDNFATLVAAVEEGRVVYGNIRKFIRYLLSCNIGEVLTMFAGMLMGLPVVLLPIQILLVNLATDGLPAMALGLEPAEPGVMEEKPRPAGASVFSGGLLGTIVFRGCIIALTTLAVFTATFRSSGSVDAARTAALVTLVMSQLFHVFECKSEKLSIFKINPLSNPTLVWAAAVSMLVTAAAVYLPWAQDILSTTALGAVELLRAVLYAVAAPLISALVMLIPKRKQKAPLPHMPAKKPLTVENLQNL